MRIVCASLPGPGHCYPMLAVARELAARGHEVVLASGEQHRSDAARAGAAFVELPGTRGSPIGALELYEDARGMAEAFHPALEALAPDVLVHDVITMGPALSADMLGLPWATLVVHGLHTPSRDLPPYGWARPPGRRALGRRRDEWMRRGKDRDMARARDELNQARAQLGLPPTERLDGQLSADLVLVATLPSLELPRSDWPASAHVVGPCLWSAEGGAVEIPPGDAPLVLLAASTAHDQGALVRASIEAAARLGVRAVLTVGKSEAPSALPRGVVSAPFAPHQEILPLVAAAVCNGGHGIVARSLSAGVPLIVVPGPGDQRENAYRVERAGAGVHVRLRAGQQVSAGRVERALARVLRDPRYRERAGEIRREAEGLDGPARAAELVEALGLRRSREGSRLPK